MFTEGLHRTTLHILHGVILCLVKFIRNSVVADADKACYWLQMQVYKALRGGVTTVAVKVMTADAVVGGNCSEVVGPRAAARLAAFQREVRRMFA